VVPVLVLEALLLMLVVGLAPLLVVPVVPVVPVVGLEALLLMLVVVSEVLLLVVAVPSVPLQEQLVVLEGVQLQVHLAVEALVRMCSELVFVWPGCFSKVRLM
jgi:hypothetical protein